MGTSIGLLILGIVLGVLAGALVGTRVLGSRRLAAAETEHDRVTGEAARAADAIRREAQVEAREEALKLRAGVDQEVRDKRAEVSILLEKGFADYDVGGGPGEKGGQQVLAQFFVPAVIFQLDRHAWVILLELLNDVFPIGALDRVCGGGGVHHRR